MRDGSRVRHWAKATIVGLALLLTFIAPGEARANAVMVRDLTPGASGTHPSDLTPFAGGVLFATLSPVLGESLWRSDGTWRGTQELAGGIAPKELTAAGGQAVLFAGTDGAGDELWRTDGTPTGTARLEDIRPGAESSFPRDLTAVGDVVFFTADDGTHGPELWKSDPPSVGGTTLVKDVRPGAEYWSFIREMTPVGPTLYFTADDGVTRSGVWKSDTTEAGTTLVWSGDAAGCVPHGLTAVTGTLFFTCRNQLWSLTPDGTQLVRDFDDEPSLLTAAGGTLYFRAYTPAEGWELWRSDGTADGTRLVKDIARGAADSKPASLTAVGDRLLFSADDGTHGLALWRSDGTAWGTRRVVPGPRDAVISDITDVDGTAFFRAGTGLWAAPAWGGAMLVRRFLDPLFGNFTAAGDRLFFSAADRTHGVELWRTG